MITAGEYLERERQSETKHELVDGVAVGRAGESPKHDALAGNVIIALARRLRGRCLV